MTDGQRREHGTVRCYEYGELGSDKADGCRCEDCAGAYRAFVAAHHRPDWVPETLMVVRAESWMVDAACRGMGPDDFHPERGATEVVRAAKAVCSGCTVTDECLSYSMQNRIKVGVWGGKSERERRRLRAANRSAPVADDISALFFDLARSMEVA